MEDENIQNDLEDNTEEEMDANNNEYPDDQNYQLEEEVAPSPISIFNFCILI